ncbi:MAG: segregation/condensation protein A [Verrucomicrobia bacterium]|nr:segregation/condensation protein A [Verrucomicrobiota bacterium]MDA1068718.1 segregation/condensation protein A [Verrucomicrobiota bacterium]
MEDALLKDLTHPIKLEVFEGPLDLLLFLIRKQEIDIYDIPVEKVTRQYLAVIYEMEKLNLELAGEFFVMAASLMEIKSRMLLPKSEQVVAAADEEEDNDPRWELVHQLLEYKKFKEAAGDLGFLIQHQQNLVPREVTGRQSDLGPRPLKKSDKMQLWGAFNQVLRRLSDRLVVGEIHDENYTIADRMEFILTITSTSGRHALTELFKGKTTLTFVVYTFLACLELTRLRKVSVWQDESFSEIYFEGITEIELETEEDTLFVSETNGR